MITQNGETITYDSENEDQAEDVAAVAGGLGAKNAVRGSGLFCR